MAEMREKFNLVFCHWTLGPNPSSEVRMPKEGRNPKLEEWAAFFRISAVGVRSMGVNERIDIGHTLEKFNLDFKQNEKSALSHLLISVNLR